MSIVNIADLVVVPEWVDDLDSFRRWARSDDYPESGWVSFLAGEIWVDPDMEELFTHNAVKTEFTVKLGSLVAEKDLGWFFSDRAAYSSPVADLATEPDGLFVSHESIESGAVEFGEGAEGRAIEVIGAADMVLEIVSRHSVRKDTVSLRELYWKAGVSEYWLVDARPDEPRFEILTRMPDGYAASAEDDGWQRSAVFGRRFRLRRAPSRSGHPRFALDAEPISIDE